MRKLNYPLIIGTIIVLGLILVVIFQDQLIQFDPYASNYGQVEYNKGNIIVTRPPEPPNQVHIFGTDILGRDIFSQIVVGTRISLKIALLTTIFRFIIAIPVAFFAGFGGKISSRFIKFFSTAFSAIPALIVSIILLSFARLRMLELDQSIIAFAIVLTFVGWGRLANILQVRIKDILSQDFIQGEIAIGKSNVLIATQNILPHLLASMIVYAFLEISRVLLMIAGLGVFEVYVGKNMIDSDTIRMMRLTIIPNFSPEWGGMLASARYAISAMKPWVALFPALAFFISIMGFNLMGEGLKHEVTKRNSMVITWIKRFAFHLSPKTYIYEIRHYRKHKKTLTIKTLIIIAIIVIPLIPPPGSLYELDKEAVFNHVQEFSKDKYGGRLVSTNGRDEAVKYIVNELKKSNLQPVYDDSFVKEVNVRKVLSIINNLDLLIRGKDDNVIKSFKYREDFNNNDFFYRNLGEDYDSNNLEIVKELSGEILTYRQFEKGEFDSEKDYIVILDDVFYSLDESEYGFFIYGISSTPCVNGIIMPTENRNSIEEKSINKIVDYEYYYNRKVKHWGAKPFIIRVTQEAGREILAHQGEEITLQNDGNILPNYKIKNIIGMIEGKSNDEPIIIATNYDYLGFDNGGEFKGLYENGSSVATIIEIAKKLASVDEKPEKTIIFAFLDSSKFQSQGAGVLCVSDFMDKNSFYMYLNYLGLETSEKLYIDTSFIYSSRSQDYEYVKYIKRRAEQLEIPMTQSKVSNGQEDASKFKADGVSGVVIKGVKVDELTQYNGLKQGDLDLINKDKLKNQAQLILDTIVEIAY